MDLNNKIWQTLEGGYKIPYDASSLLKDLKETNNSTTANHIFSELWENLHHQGDVGAASYLSSIALIDICITKNSFDWNYIGLILIIENCRLTDPNPPPPDEIKSEYFSALILFEEYLLNNFRKITDQTSLRLSLAFFATVHNHINLGKAIEQLDDDVLKEFLEQY